MRGRQHLSPRKALFTFGVVLAGCGGSATTTPTTQHTTTTDAGTSDAVDAAAPGVDASEDAGSSSSEDAGPPAQRNAACTPTSDQTGTLCSSPHGRLDGTLVYVLPLNGSYSCNGDNAHVHLQVEAKGNVYDIAVDVGQTSDEVGMVEQTIDFPYGTWSEGFQGYTSFSYPTFKLTSSMMPLQSPDAIAQAIEAALTPVSKISIFCTSYAQGNGCHDVHYENGNGSDGAIILDPTSPSSPALFFRFSDQTF